MQEKQKREFDKQRHPGEFKIGDLVLVYRPTRKIGRAEKLLHRWHGPYIVVKQLTAVNYLIREWNDTSKEREETIHVERWKRFVEAIPEATSTLRPIEHDQPRGASLNENPIARERKEGQTPTTGYSVELEWDTKDSDEAETDLEGENGQRPQIESTSTSEHEAPVGVRRNPHRSRKKSIKFMLGVYAFGYPLFFLVYSSYARRPPSRGNFVQIRGRKNFLRLRMGCLHRRPIR